MGGGEDEGKYRLEMNPMEVVTLRVELKEIDGEEAWTTAIA